MLDKTLVFSVAMNGYQWRYKALLESHQSCCNKHGYDYVCIEKPSSTSLGLEVAWLKICLIIRALKNGYRWVVFLDADTRVNAHTPPVETLEEQNKYIYMAKGYSDRINSGVIIVRNNTASRYFFRTVLANARTPIPSEDQVGWGENGHIIHYAKRFKEVRIISNAWNNNHQETGIEYIRHYSAGPFRNTDKPTFRSLALYRLHHYSLALRKRFRALFHVAAKDSFEVRLETLSEQVAVEYPVFQSEWLSGPSASGSQAITSA